MKAQTRWEGAHRCLRVGAVPVLSVLIESYIGHVNYYHRHLCTNRSGNLIAAFDKKQKFSKEELLELDCKLLYIQH